jgi:hypothetical protein
MPEEFSFNSGFDVFLVFFGESGTVNVQPMVYAFLFFVFVRMKKNILINHYDYFFSKILTFFFNDIYDQSN